MCKDYPGVFCLNRNPNLFFAWRSTLRNIWNIYMFDSFTIWHSISQGLVFWKAVQSDRECSIHQVGGFREELGSNHCNDSQVSEKSPVNCGVLILPSKKNKKQPNRKEPITSSIIFICSIRMNKSPVAPERLTVISLFQHLFQYWQSWVRAHFFKKFCAGAALASLAP